ncbi:MAG: protoheme IX farnesyltransferase [Planctomycetia bacterium]|nr:MAG: protoheme IX farnesyltransferase [Planctomycetia bacterium]
MSESTGLMQPAPLAAPSTASDRAADPLGLLSAYIELSKARLSALVLATTAVGFVLGTQMNTPRAWALLFWTLVGTALCAFGANAMNQWIEHARDARMERTRGRPLPAGLLSRPHALTFALLTAIGGPLLLAWQTNLLTAMLGLLTTLLYVAAYTPLKPLTPLNTVVGAVCGAIPPMMGWTAATGELALPAWILGGLLFLWQIPHALALSWLYRDDYERGGFRMLPIIDPSGRLTCQAAVLYALALLPFGLMLTLHNVCGAVFAIGSLVTGLLFVLTTLWLFIRRDRDSARRVFFASILYLPVVMVLMVADRTPLNRSGVYTELIGIYDAPVSVTPPAETPR